jgi:hypothetical protein
VSDVHAVNPNLNPAPYSPAGHPQHPLLNETMTYQLTLSLSAGRPQHPCVRYAGAGDRGRGGA